MSRPSSTEPRGFSIIEVLTAVSLLSFITVGVLLMTTTSIKSNSFNQHHTKAVQLAEAGLELLKRVDYLNELPNYDGASSVAVADYGSIAGYGEYRRVLAVEWGMEISTLTSRVTWRSLGMDSQPIVLTTMRVRP